MTQPRDEDHIAHVIEVCEQAAAFTAARTREDLERDRVLQLAVVKLVEIVGEAAKAVTDETRAQYPEVPWSSQPEPATASSITTSTSTWIDSGAP
jgi:uncharacterized protein with HEPN domain